MFYLIQVEVLHLGKLWNLLHGVLEGDLGVNGDVTDLTDHQREIFGKSVRIFVPEGETFMQFDLALDIRGDDWLGENVGEVAGELNWVDALDFTTGHLRQLGESIEVALISSDRDNVNRESHFLGIFS